MEYRVTQKCTQTMSALMPAGNQVYFSLSSCSPLETGVPFTSERDLRVVKGVEPGPQFVLCWSRGQPQFTHFLLHEIEGPARQTDSSNKEKLL